MLCDLRSDKFPLPNHWHGSGMHNLLYVHHHNPLLIWNRSWILTIHKASNFKKNAPSKLYSLYLYNEQFNWFFFVIYWNIFNCFKALAMKMRAGVLKRTYLFWLLAFFTSFLWPYEKINFKLVSVCAIVHMYYVVTFNVES